MLAAIRGCYYPSVKDALQKVIGSFAQEVPEKVSVSEINGHSRSYTAIVSGGDYSSILSNLETIKQAVVKCAGLPETEPFKLVVVPRRSADKQIITEVR